MTFVKKALAYVLFCYLTLAPLSAAGTTLTLPQGEACISHLFKRLAGFTDDRDKKRLADSISRLLNEVLVLPGSFDYPFDQLNRLGKIKSRDEKVRIYTWNMPWSDGTNTYYGFLQYKTENKKEVKLVTLTDRRAETTDPAGAILTPDHWFGMLIYGIVETEFNRKVFYTLLGFDNENLFLSRKITDVLYFDDIQGPLFGKAIFHYHNAFLCRILFGYSAKVQMSLKWNEKLKMIVFDHLSPPNPSQEGNFQFYGPDLSFDALKFENGVWEMVENVDVRNSRE